MENQPNQYNIENKHIEMWKIKRIIKKLDASKG
jgi:hypothetical protein